METLLLKVIESEYSIQLLSLVAGYFLIIKLVKILRLFLVYFFKNIIDDFNKIKKNSSDYEIFKKEIEDKLENMSARIEQIDADSKKRSEKNENKIYEIWKR